MEAWDDINENYGQLSENGKTKLDYMLHEMKKIISVLLVIGVMFSLSGCSESKAEESKTMDDIPAESTSQSGTEEASDESTENTTSDIISSPGERNLNMEQYDTVFIGYPVWAAEVPQAVLSFLNEYDLTGKTVVPFCTHDGYGAGGSYHTIREASHGLVLLDGLAIEAKDVPSAKNTVTEWLSAIGKVTSDLSVFDTLGSREEITFSLAEQ